MTPKEKKRRQAQMKKLEKALHFIAKTGVDAIRKAKKLEAAMLAGDDISLAKEALDIVVKTHREVSSPSTAAGKVLIQANGGSFDIQDEDSPYVKIPENPIAAQIKMQMTATQSSQLEMANILAKKGAN
jgi:hypothetical protein